MWFDSDHFRSLGSSPALIEDKQEVSHARLGARIVNYREALQRDRFSFGGAVIAIDGRYSFDLCALWFALVKDGAIIVPLPPGPPSKRDEFTQIARVQASVSLDSAGVLTVRSESGDGVHDLYDRLRERQAPGLVLFSSGTTGKPKASVLDFNRLLARYQGAKRPRRTLAFLSLDHIGGINTLMNTVFNGGAVITTDDRSPASVFRAVAAHRVDTLPTTPTFLTMSLISGELERHDLTSLRLVTYGTEPMPAQTLRKIHSVLPHVRLKQTYGLSEVGILPTVSRSNDSLWLKLGGAGFEHKIVNGILWIRSQMAMLGYLNAHAPFDEEGWFDTRDAVEVDGQHIQGMALMEAARQMWTAVTERYLQPESTGRRFVIDVVNTTFLRFVFPVGGYIRYRLMNKTVSVVETVYDCQIEIAQGDATRATIEARYRVIDERVGEKQEALAARHTIRTLLGQTNALGSSGGRAL